MTPLRLLKAEDGGHFSPNMGVKGTDSFGHHYQNLLSCLGFRTSNIAADGSPWKLEPPINFVHLKPGTQPMRSVGAMSGWH